MVVRLWMHKYTALYLTFLYFPKWHLQQHRFLALHPAPSVCWPQHKGPTTAAASSFPRGEAWSPACSNRAREQSWTEEPITNRFFSWKMPVAWWQVSLVQIPAGEWGWKRHHNPLTRQGTSWRSSALLICTPWAVGRSYAQYLPLEPSFLASWTKPVVRQTYQGGEQEIPFWVSQLVATDVSDMQQKPGKWQIQKSLFRMFITLFFFFWWINNRIKRSINDFWKRYASFLKVAWFSVSQYDFSSSQMVYLLKTTTATVVTHLPV